MGIRPLLLATTPGGVSHYWRDEADGSSTIILQQDVRAALEQSKAMRLHNDGYSETRELRRVAHIPHIVRNKWLAEEGWDAYRADLYPEKLAQKLMDPDWAHLRTADGRVGVSNGVLR